MKKPELSIVIPTLNEADCLPGLLADLLSQAQVAAEIIAGDGGSTDDTRAIVAKAGGRVVKCPRGRGRQMNRAAEQARGNYLLFLHADSRMSHPDLLKNGLKALKKTIVQVGHERVAGHFKLHFIRGSNRHKMAFRYIEGKTAFNRPNTTSGDQGFLMTAAFFRQLGCFDTQLPFLEDQRLAEKIRAIGQWITLPGRLATSARRFEKEGFHRRYILMSIIMGLHSTGMDQFFSRAKTIYPSQGETGHLGLSPFFKAGWEMMRQDLGFGASVVLWFHIGRYVRRNSWQLFYFMDILSRQDVPGRFPFLTFHDRYFGPLTNFSICDALTAVVCFVWFMLVLGPFFGMVEHGRQQKAFKGGGLKHEN